MVRLFHRPTHTHRTEQELDRDREAARTVTQRLRALAAEVQVIRRQVEREKH